MTIKIAHEAPLSIFDEVQDQTDYDYALVHLFDESEEAQIWTSRNQRDTQVKNFNQNPRKENLKNFFLATIGPTKLLLGITLVLVIISIICIVQSES